MACKHVPLSYLRVRRYAIKLVKTFRPSDSMAGTLWILMQEKWSSTLFVNRSYKNAAWWHSKFQTQSSTIQGDIMLIEWTVEYGVSLVTISGIA